MQRYVKSPDPKTSVKVYGRSLRVSAKDSAIVCKAITGKTLEKGKQFLVQVQARKASLDGKFHDSATDQVHQLLVSAEANTEAKGLAADRMFIHASVHRGFTFHTPRRFKQRGRRRRVTNIQVILEQR